MNPAKKHKTKATSLHSDRCSVAGDKIFSYKAPGSSILENFISVQLLMVAFSLIPKSNNIYSGLFEIGSYSSKNEYYV